MSLTKVTQMMTGRVPAVLETSIGSCHRVLTSLSSSSLFSSASNFSSRALPPLHPIVTASRLGPIASPILLSPSASFHTSSRDCLRERRERQETSIREIPSKQKYNPVDLATSQAYLKSEAYAKTYEGLPVWHSSLYRRNYRGSYNPIMTRPDCVIDGYLCSNPCPICRDDHLLVHHENLELIKQFILPKTGAVLSHRQTNVCMHQHSRVEIAIGRARDRGLLEMRVPFRDYDYGDFYPKDLLEECDYEDILSPAETAFLARTKDVAERQLGRNDVVYEDAFALDEDDDFDESDDSDSDRENVQ